MNNDSMIYYGRWEPTRVKIDPLDPNRSHLLNTANETSKKEAGPKSKHQQNARKTCVTNKELQLGAKQRTTSSSTSTFSEMFPRLNTRAQKKNSKSFTD